MSIDVIYKDAGVLVEEVAGKMEGDIKHGKVHIVSPSAIVQYGMGLMNGYDYLKGSDKKAVLLEVIRRVAVGADGVAGTADDIIPPIAVRGLTVLLEQNLVGDVIDLVAGLTKGKVDVEKAKRVGEAGKTVCVGCVIPFLKNLKNKRKA